MDGWLTNLARVAWTQCWQVTLLIAVVWLTVRFAGRNRPHLASILWLVVLLKCVTPPIWSSPSGVFCWLQRSDGSAANQSASELPMPQFSAAPNASSVLTENEADAVVVQVAAQPMPQPDPGLLAISEAGPSPARPPDQRSVLPSLLLGGLILWLAGCVVFAAATMIRLWSCWRKLRAAGAVSDPNLEAVLSSLRQQFGIRRTVRLWITPSHVGPAVVGLWRPLVIVPAALVHGKSPDELAPLLAHELVHIRRGDLWLGLLQTLAQSLWWFHPLVRLASRLFTREAERCCDEAVIAHLACTPAAYARSLLDVLALKQQLQPVPSFPGVRPVDVTRGRLERIMQLRHGCRTRTPWWCWLVLALVAAAALPGAALMVGADENKSTSDQPLSAAALDVNRIRLQTMTVEPPASATGKLVVQTYDLADLVEKFCKEVVEPRQSARTAIEWHVERSAPGPWKTKGIRVADPQTITKMPPGLRERLEANESARFEHGWVDDKLIVVHTAAGHEQIERQLQILRGQQGLTQLSIEVRILSVPVIALDRVAANWKLIGATPDNGSGELQPDQNSAGGPNAQDESVPNIRGRVESVIERQLPAILALLDDNEAGLVINASQGDSRTNILQAPKVTVFNGQSARIEDITQRPFVVGIKPSSGGGEQPQIRVVSEGTSIRLRPELKGEGKVLLDLGLTLSHIRGVETAQIPIAGQHNPIRVQVPEVGITRLNSTVEMDLDQMLAIGLPASTSGKASMPGCILVKVRNLGVEPEAAAIIPLAEELRKRKPAPQPIDFLKKRESAPREQPASATHNMVDERSPSGELIDKVYPVADLVVPIPFEPLVIRLLDAKADPLGGKAVTPDYESLIDLVTATIAPQSWDSAGGLGTIVAKQNRLSLIVRNSEEVHSQIADCFESLRRLQDVQILWTVEAVEASQRGIAQWARDVQHGALAQLGSPKIRLATISPQELRSLRKAVELKRVSQEPRVTMFNGQSLDLRFESPNEELRHLISRVQLQPTVSADFRSIRMMVGVGEGNLNRVDPKNPTWLQPPIIPHGHSVLIDLDQQRWEHGEVGIPLQAKGGDGARLFQNASLKPPVVRHLCLLTPQVLVASRQPYLRVLTPKPTE